MSRFTLANNISVFNVKPVYNEFVAEMEMAGYKNIIRNPGFTEQIDGLTYRWTSGIDLLAYDTLTNAGDITYTLQQDEFIRQDVTQYLEINGRYAGTFRINNSSPLRILLEGGPNDISNTDLGQVSKSEITLPACDGTTWNNVGFLASTRSTPFDATNLFSSPILLSFISEDPNNQVAFGGIYLSKGAVNFTGLSTDAPILDNVRYNKVGKFWEITHNGTEWYRLWNDDLDFELRVLDIFSSLTVDGFLSPGDIIAGVGIDIQPIYSGTAVIGIEIINTGSGTAVGDGTAIGDWTREDMNYQSMLEHSGYEYVVYDRLTKPNLINAFGSITHYTAAIGYYRFQPGATIETVNILPAYDSTGPFYSFFPSFDAEGITAEFSLDDGTSWIALDSDELVTVPTGWDSLKFKFSSGGTTGYLYSYGVLFGESTYSYGSAFAFRERYTVLADSTAGTIFTLPNNLVYHSDGKSLIITLNRATLIEGLDYNEVVGSGISNTVEFLIDTTVGDEIVYQEYYGQVDASTDNIALINLVDATHAADMAIINSQFSTINTIDTTQNSRIVVLENASGYVHPLTSGNRHIPTGGGSLYYLGWFADGTAQWLPKSEFSYGTALHEAPTNAFALQTYTWAHGLNRFPSNVRVWAQCHTPVSGFIAGDCVEFVSRYTSGTFEKHLPPISWNATNIYITRFDTYEAQVRGLAQFITLTDAYFRMNIQVW